MFSWFSRKKEVKKIQSETKQGFEAVKKDINSIGEWIKHLNSEKDHQKKDIQELKEILSTVQEDLEEVKNFVSVLGDVKKGMKMGRGSGLFKQQTAVYPVQTAVQTAVQTPKFDQFSMTERALLWVLLNTDMKLAFEDLAVILGKEKATIRGQINTIKQKSPGVLQEIIEPNGKKRVFIPEYLREKMLKKTKVRVKKGVKKVLNNKKTTKIRVRT